MAYKVVYSPNAQENLHQILEYLVDVHSFIIAEKFSEYLISVTEMLEKQPYSGRMHPVLSAVREFPVKPYYLVFYSVLEQEEIVHILNIIDTRRQLK